MALEGLLASPEFLQSPKLGQLLRFLAAQPEGEAPKETVIGVAVFGREAGYDPKADPVVRVEVRRLRAKLLEYYEGTGSEARLRVEIPKGAYAVQYRERVVPVEAGAGGERLGPHWIALGLVAAGAVLLGYLLARTGAATAVEHNAAPKQVTANEFNSRSPAWSEDGTKLAFSRDGEARSSHILVMEHGNAAVQVTTGNVRDSEPAWSPTGALGFLRESGGGFLLMLKDRLDAPEREIARLRMRQPFGFARDGKAVYVSDRESGEAAARLWKIEIEGGKRVGLTAPGTSTVGDLSPKVSPDGKRIAFVRATEESVRDLWVLELEGGGARALTREGRPVEGFDWGYDGKTIVASMERGNQARSLWELNVETGQGRRIAAAGLGPIQPAVDRVKKRIAYVVRMADTNVWRLDLRGSLNPRPLTSSIQLDTSGQIAPDGERIAFRSARSGANELWMMSATGGAPRQLTRFEGPLVGSPRWSPDGSRLVFESRVSGNGDVYVMAAAGGAYQALTREGTNEVLPSWSRDGKSIYFSSDRTGRWEVYRKELSGGGVSQVTRGGGFAAFESRDGRYVYYTKQNEGGGVWRVSVEGGEEEMVAPLPVNFWGQWAVGRRGLFYVAVTGGGEKQIVRLDLKTGQRKVIFECGRLPVQFDSSMSVSEDESYLVWSQLDASSSDVFVLEGGGEK